jgi:hypothetical protein
MLASDRGMSRMPDEEKGMEVSVAGPNLDYEGVVGLVISEGDGAEGEGVPGVGAAYVEVALGVYSEGVSFIVEGAAGFWLQWAYPLKS